MRQQKATTSSSRAGRVGAAGVQGYHGCNLKHERPASRALRHVLQARAVAPESHLVHLHFNVNTVPHDAGTSWPPGVIQGLRAVVACRGPLFQGWASSATTKNQQYVLPAAGSLSCAPATAASSSDFRGLARLREELWKLTATLQCLNSMVPSRQNNATPLEEFSLMLQERVIRLED